MTHKLKSAFTLACGQNPLLNSDFRKSAFTLAEVLITLSIIGIVAALTIPGVVKHHNEKAWATGQDLFIKKLEVALKSMNTDGKLTGYTTTADFVNELKNNIKINKVCTDDVTRCFSKNITWGVYKEHNETINNNAVMFSGRKGFDWAETVGVQFNNGVTALIAYNKKCYADPYYNQGSVNNKCLGLLYDVSGNTKPNAYGNDIMVNANVSKINGKSLCVYTLPEDGTCFTKILAPKTGYSPFPMEIDGEMVTCAQAIAKGYIESSFTTCTYGEGGSTQPDYWAGAQYACGGEKKYLPTQGQLLALAKYVYGNENIYSDTPLGGLSFKDDRAQAFLSTSPIGSGSNAQFVVWANHEVDSNRSFLRPFRKNDTDFHSYYRHYIYALAVCLEE